MDKMIQGSGGDVLISNDGATILTKMEVQHPCAKMLVDLSKSQDIEAGDGTTSVVVVAGAMLNACTSLLDKGIHPTIISESFGKAVLKAVEILRSIARPVNLSDREYLVNCVSTALSSKQLSSNADVLAPLAVDAVLRIINTEKDRNVDLNNIKVVKQLGGTVDETELVEVRPAKLSSSLCYLR